jgi:hypothetical protein
MSQLPDQKEEMLWFLNSDARDNDGAIDDAHKI